MKDSGNIPGKEAGDSSRFSSPPQDYFEKLEKSLAQRIAEKPASLKKGMFTIRVLIPLLAAAVLIIGLFIMLPGDSNPNELKLQAELEKLTEDEIVATLISERIDLRELDVNYHEMLLSDSAFQDSGFLEQLSSDPELEYLIEEL